MPFGVPLCLHLRTCRQPWLKYVKWYTGSGLDTEFICVPCAEAREKGLSVEAEPVCEECFEYATTEVGDLVKTGGKAEIRIRSAELNPTLKRTGIPRELGRIADIAPIPKESSNIWLMLAENGGLFRLDVSNGEWAKLESASKLPEVEVDRPAFLGHTLRRHLYTSPRGEFAAVVNDYGRYGQVIDLATGKITLTLDGGNYHPETVPFSFTFAEHQGRAVAIHRTGWNRLDISDALTGRLLSERGPTSYRDGEERPQHYLDYFHGALYLSPGGSWILDDGWVWHPVGIPIVWNVARWLSENVWESEDGPTRKDVCARDYYWDHGIAWLDEETVAIAGIGDDDAVMIEGARIFDVTSSKAGDKWRSDWLCAREVTAFAGPAGRFFSDGKWLYSADATGLSKWDPKSGDRTGQIENFHPTHHHLGTGELVQLEGDVLVRWSTRE